MSSWSTNYSRGVPRPSLRPTSSFDYQHGHSDNTSLEGGKSLRSHGPGRGWHQGTNSKAVPSSRSEGPVNNYQQRSSAESGQPFKSWNARPEWRTNDSIPEGSGATLLGSGQTRTGNISQASLNWLPDLSPVKKSMDLLLKTTQELSSPGPISHGSGFALQSYSSLISGNDGMSQAANQRKKSSKAFDYLKSWRLKMNMPTDSFMVEKEVLELSKRISSDSAFLDESPSPTTTYTQSAVNVGSTRSSSMDGRSGSSSLFPHREYTGHSSDAQFDRQMHGSPGQRIPNADQSAKTGGRICDPAWKWNSNAQNSPISGYKRNYNPSLTGQSVLKTGVRDTSPMAGSLGAKRPRLKDSYDEGSRHTPHHYDGSYQKQTFGQQEYAGSRPHSASNFYDSPDWKNPSTFPKRGSSDWNSRSGIQSTEPSPDNWMWSQGERKGSPHGLNESQSPRKINGGKSPRQPNWPDSPALMQRNSQAPYARGASPEQSSWAQLSGAPSRGRSPGSATSRVRSPGSAHRGRTPAPPQRGSPGPVSRGWSPGTAFKGRSPRFSPKGRSPELLLRGKSPGLPHKQRSQRTSTVGRSQRSISRGRSPRQHSRRSMSPMTDGISSSSLARGRSSGSQRSPDHARGKSPDHSTRGRLQYQSTRGRSPGGAVIERTHRHHASRSPTSLTQGRAPKPSDERTPLCRKGAPGHDGRDRSPGHFRRGGSPGHGSRGRFPVCFGRDRNPECFDREGPKQFARDRSPRRYVRDRSPGIVSKVESPGNSGRDRSRGAGRDKSPGSTGRDKSPLHTRGRAPGFVDKDRSNLRHIGRARSPLQRRRISEERIHRSSAQFNRGRSPGLVGETPAVPVRGRMLDVGQSRQRGKRWHQEVNKETDRKTLSQGKRSPQTSDRRRPVRKVSPARLQDNRSLDHKKSGRCESHGRSPLFDELSPSPRSSKFWSPCLESLQGKKPRHERRGSWSPVDLQRGCSPVSPQPTFECADAHNNIVEGSPLSASSYHKNSGDMVPSELQRGCSPVSPEGYSRHWSNNTAKLRGSSPIDSRKISCLKRSVNKSSDVQHYKGRAGMEHISESYDIQDETSRDEVLDAEGNESGKGDEDDEDLRVHLLRLREKKVEMKLRMLEEESIETEYQLRQLQKKKLSEEDEDLLRKHEGRFWNDEDLEGRRGSRDKSSRSSCSIERFSSHSEDRRDARIGHRDCSYTSGPERSCRNKDARRSPHSDRSYQRKGRY